MVVEIKIIRDDGTTAVTRLDNALVPHNFRTLPDKPEEEKTDSKITKFFGYTYQPIVMVELKP